MASYVPPIKNGASGCIFYCGLPSVATSGAFQSNPTLAAGDVKISLDGGALNNLGTLPAVTPASSKVVKVTLSQAETNADNIAIVFSDAAGDEWSDLIVSLQTVARQIDDLAFPNTSGRGIDVDASGGVEVGSFQANAITAAAIADGAIDAATFAANAINASKLDPDVTTELQSGLATATNLSTLQNSVNDLPTNAELATALGTADDAVLTAVAALPTANQNADALLDRTDGIEGGLTPRNALRLAVASAAGKLSGADTATNTIRNAVADSKNRMVATVDENGNRTSITYDLT